MGANIGSLLFLGNESLQPQDQPDNFTLKPRNSFKPLIQISDSQRTVREAISKICSKFPDKYWLHTDKTKKFPSELHSALAEDGWLGICMLLEYGGSDLGILEAAIMMQTIAEFGASMTGASAVHMNIFGLEPVVKFKTEEQKKRFLIPFIKGKECACFGVTEPNTGLDMLRFQSPATRDGDYYILRGSKIWISTAQFEEKILTLTRAMPLDKVTKPSQGLSLFYTNLDRSQVEVKEIPKIGRATVDTNTLFFD
jgi:alkylation response protein AidB-like acyl-CoA dehydrogenase